MKSIVQILKNKSESLVDDSENNAILSQLLSYVTITLVFRAGMNIGENVSLLYRVFRFLFSVVSTAYSIINMRVPKWNLVRCTEYLTIIRQFMDAMKHEGSSFARKY